MRHPEPPLQATFLERPNRFLGVVNLNGKKVQCFIPNPGRMNELLTPKRKVFIFPKTGKHRKTKYDLTMVELDNTLVSIDSRLPNKLLRESIDRGLEEFRGYTVKGTEPTFGDSRLDLKLTDGAKQILLEAKSCTLVMEGVAYFPDAPTRRGARHMNTLVKALEHGRATVCFIVQRNDAHEWRPYEIRDPQFTNALRNAVKNGVEAYAYTCKVSIDSVSLEKRIPIKLD